MTRPLRRRPALALCAALALLALASLAPVAYTEVTQGNNVRVIFKGRLMPRSLPRTGLAPVRVEIADADVRPWPG